MCSDRLVYNALRSLIAVRHYTWPALEERRDKRRARYERDMEFLHDLQDQINISEPTRRKPGEPHHTQTQKNERKISEARLSAHL